MFGIITGSGFYDLQLDNKQENIISTEFGDAVVTTGSICGQDIAFIARHGSNHKYLPHMINYKANIKALQTFGVSCIIGTTVCGVTNPDLKLAQLLVFSDLFFPDNRLPDGEICSFFNQPGGTERGHLIFGSPLNQNVTQALLAAYQLPELTYAHVNGPRFNTKAEISYIKNYADAVSQTCGPEIVLANELEISFVLLGIGVDYANGIKSIPTPIDVLKKNMEVSKGVLTKAIETIIKNESSIGFDGFIYKFD